MQSGYNIDELVHEAKNRWLKPAEVLSILQNHEHHQFTQTPPQKPLSGSMFLFNKRVLRFFRRDGHIWRKKKDGRTVAEAHERLKVGNAETLNCYYAHGEQNPNFQRRSYWMLDPAYEHIVLVHYREINEGKYISGSASHTSPRSSSTLTQSSSLFSSQNPGSTPEINELYEPNRSSFSPGSVEVSSELARNNGMDHLDGTDFSGELSSSSEPEVSQALRRIEEQLSLNDDDLAELPLNCTPNVKGTNAGVIDFERGTFKQDEHLLLRHDSEFKGQEEWYRVNAGMQLFPNNHHSVQNAGDKRDHKNQTLSPVSTLERKKSPFWKDMLELSANSIGINSQEKIFNTSDGNEMPSSLEREKFSSQQENWPSQGLDFFQNNPENRSNYYPISGTNLGMQHSAAKEFLVGSDNPLVSPTPTSLLQEVEDNTCTYPFGSTNDANPEYFGLWFDQESQFGVPLGTGASLTLSQKQKFSILEISPEWGYTSENTKVIVTGSFYVDPSECAWKCMFGDIEVPVQIIQEGVLRCQAPSHLPGKVTVCITSGNRESCSEVREFEYRSMPKSCAHCNLPNIEAIKSTEELLLLVRFAQMILSTPLEGDSVESGNSKIDENPWEHIIEALLIGSETPSGTMDRLLQELLKEKLQQWLWPKYQENGECPDCSLSKKEQGVIHMIAGLGYQWALNPILDAGVGINFRDMNGWTALHWAARFGREKMVAALIAAGASAGAVTDPTPKDPTGKTPASIAIASGHRGLAGYLSELALTDHLSSLTLEESELSKGSAAVEAEKTMESISTGNLGATEDQLSLKDSLAAVRNAAQAAARIQSAFRAHSFRKRQERDADASSYNDYKITPDDIYGLPVASKLTFRNHKFDKAALSIQKKYRGWKGRKEFLALRQKVVKIQAHVRGHQVRKKYKVILWAVGVLDKVVLRWRRRGVGLRGFRHDSDSINESEDEDMLKVFRKQKVDGALDEAVSTVLSMVESSDARQQYRRMLERFRQAKAELGDRAKEMASTTNGDGSNMDDIDDDIYQFLLQDEL